MKGNPLLKFLVIPAVILAVLMGIKLFGGQPKPEAVQGDTVAPKLSTEQAKALGVTGDTASDTLRTMAAEGRELKLQIAQVITENKTQKQENDALRHKLNNIDETVQMRVEAARNQLEQESLKKQQGLQDLLKDKLDQLSKLGTPNAVGGNNEMPIGFGVQPGDGQEFKNAQDDIIWVEPRDAKSAPPGSTGAGLGTDVTFPSSFGNAIDKGQKALSAGTQQASAAISPQQEAKKVRRVYTLPQNSTLMGSVSMSALVGRVPVDGTVNDPYPFKVLIGPDNLTANGIDLPDVAGAVASGTASGDWTLSCVRGQVKSLTFVFNDGTVRTLPAPAKDGQQNNSNQNQSQTSGENQPVQGGMGWISDPYGIPCIAGERRSNAAEYIGSQALVTAAGAGAASLIKSDSTSSSYVSTSSGTLGTTGISGNQAMGQILNQGVSDISTWVNKLYGQAFAAVYVQPGAKVALHLDQELAIDYEIKGRKVNYGTTGERHAANLD
ncbi:TIGR03752 family integrating conjugative element protein [Pseudomonas cichorii]|nr:TIGR03752 family integrating conjugative element protein [Pseudomonas cichorii]